MDMNVRLALVSAPITLLERYGDFVGAASTEPSFGLTTLAAAAREAGADVAIIEASAANLSVDAALQRVQAFSPHVVGFTATTAGVCAAAELAARLKAAAPATLTLVGGCHVTALPHETLTEFPGFDLVVYGEGEHTLVDILQRMRDGDAIPSGVPGTAERTSEGIRVNEPRALIADLDQLPLPAWDLLEGFPRLFRPSPARIKRMPCASIVLTRGCPNTCTFCDRSVFGNRCRSYSPAYAVRLLKDLRNNYGVKEILLEDDTFIIRKGNVQELCERLLADKVDITWSCLGRADRVDPDLLKLMRRAGCWHLSFGIENGDPDMLKAMNKNLDVAQIRQAVRWCREAGILTKGFFIVGFPGETEASVDASIRLARSMPLDDISVMQLTPFPGSAIYATAEAHGTFNKDWRRMNTLDTVFVPQGFTKEGLEQARSRMYRAFYLRPSAVLRYGLRIVRNPRILGDVLRGIKPLLLSSPSGTTGQPAAQA